jgi:hypothetical protein
MNATTSILDDAREIFDSYLRATNGFVRAIPLPTEGFKYPQDTVQTDCVVFAYILSCIWQAIGSPQEFPKYYALKPKAFANLATMVTPGADTGISYAGFWVQKGTNLVPTSPRTETEMWTLCRTLRNGFGHFNFRYINVAPRDYFQQLALPLPGEVIDPNLADNYRIFICDWKPGKEFLAVSSNTRIVDTQFARLRYSLFRFLTYFFAEPGRPPYKDILTKELING